MHFVPQSGLIRSFKFHSSPVPCTFYFSNLQFGFCILHEAPCFTIDPNLSGLQLFRKDLISAMKLPDNEPLEAEDYWTVTDTWKQEWERGVQVT